MDDRVQTASVRLLTRAHPALAQGGMDQIQQAEDRTAPRSHSTATGFWAAGVCHPLPLSAAFVMAVNDHWLKGSDVIPSVITGKLSDAAGLFFFPALVVAVCFGLLSRFDIGPSLRRRLPLIACVAVGLGFAAANLLAPFNELLGAFWMTKRMDPTDLWALPVLVCAWGWMRWRYA